MVTRSAPQMMALAMCSARAMPPPAMSVISSRLPVLDQRRVDLADHVLDEPGLFHADLVAVGIGHDVDHFHFGQAGQIDGPLHARRHPAALSPRRRCSGCLSLSRLMRSVDVGAVIGLHQPGLAPATSGGTTGSSGLRQNATWGRQAIGVLARRRASRTGWSRR